MLFHFFDIVTASCFCSSLSPCALVSRCPVYLVSCTASVLTAGGEEERNTDCARRPVSRERSLTRSCTVSKRAVFRLISAPFDFHSDIRGLKCIEMARDSAFVIILTWVKIFYSITQIIFVCHTSK